MLIVIKKKSVCVFFKLIVELSRQRREARNETTYEATTFKGNK